LKEFPPRQLRFITYTATGARYRSHVKPIRLLDGCQNLPDPTAVAVSGATVTLVTDASSAPSPPVTMAATTAINAITMVPSIPKKPIWPLGHSLLDYISTTRRGTDVAWEKCHLVLLVLTMYF
jgi:hypothetical protein